MCRFLAPLVLVLALSTAACTNDAGSRQTIQSSSPSPLLATPLPTPSPRPSSRPIAHNPARLADEIVSTEARLFDAIDGWLAGGTRAGLPQIALRQQKIYRLLVRRPALARKVIATLDGRTAVRVKEHVAVAADLRAGVTPVRAPVRFRTTKPAAPRRLRRYFEEAESKFGVRWEVLAAINFVESRFGRIVGPSSAGALGPMQFLPATWDRYGAGGDIFDPRDSIIAAARFLRANGAKSDLRAALLAYNNSDAYADAVLTYADDMRSDERNYYAYYFWQVFVITKRGDKQVTGPGCCNPRDA
jgi:Transglycosylase SLT domain